MPPTVQQPLPWITPEAALPAPEDARREPPYAGLLAAGQDLGPARLHEAYGKGIFPWFGEDEPVLWWSPDPRMVLRTETFRLHASLRKRIQRGIREGRLQICVDQDFERIIEHCANQPRIGQASTWIVPPMVEAYKAFHAQGYVHGISVYWDKQLIGGLYAVAIGRAVFGESMFSLAPDASKMALAALIAISRREQAPAIDCQQETAHLAFMGASPQPRNQFLEQLHPLTQMPAMDWHFDTTTWAQLDARLGLAAVAGQGVI